MSKHFEKHKFPEDALKIMTEIRESKIRAAEEWKKMQLDLLHKTLEMEIQTLNNEHERFMDEYRDKEIAELAMQFEQMLANHKTEVEAYISANPKREPVYRQLVEAFRKLKQGKKKKNKDDKPKKPQICFENEIQKVIEEIESVCTDLPEQCLFAEHSFIVRGTLFNEKNTVLFETRAREPLEADIVACNEFDITFKFRDEGELVVATEDIEEGRVTFRKKIE